MELTKTLETSVKRLFNKLTLTAFLSSPILASCQQSQPKPEKPFVVYEFIGTVKGESKGGYSIKENKTIVDPNTGRHGWVDGERFIPTYSFTLETEKGLKVFSTQISPEEFDALINVGDRIRLHYWDNNFDENVSERSTKFFNYFALREVNDKRVDFFVEDYRLGHETSTKIDRARIVKIE